MLPEAKGSIMLVDDSAEEIRMISTALLREGYEVVTARDGMEALEILERREEPFDLFLLDVVLPRIDGFELLGRIRALERFANVPAVFCTARAMDELSVEKGLHLGAIDYLNKPFKRGFFLAKAANLVRWSRAERELRSSQEELLRHRDHLEDLVAERTAQLVALNEMKDEFLVICSHDLKSPLINITGYADLLEMSFKDMKPEQIRDILRRIQGEGRRMSEFITELLDLARFESGRSELNLSPGYLATVARIGYEEFAFQAREKKLEFHFSPPPEKLPPISLDRRRASQVACNLISNAVKFTPPGGEVKVAVYGAGGCQVLEVADSGPGVPAGDLARIFDKFYQARQGREKGKLGSGLGLAICKQIADLHGGSIEVLSEEGRGARFIVRFPEKPGAAGGGVP